MTHIIALTGQTGCGKDTLAAQLCTKSYGYKRLAFGDTLRLLTAAAFGPCSPDNERDISYSDHGSFKDTMLVVGASATLGDPLTMCKSMVGKFARELSRDTQPVIVTDVRKPIELYTLQQLSLKHSLPLYFVEVLRPGQDLSTKRLDNLLTSADDMQVNSFDMYYSAGVESWSQQCDVIASHGTVVNDGTPSDMLSKLSLILELSVPYNFTGAIRNA